MTIYIKADKAMLCSDPVRLPRRFCSYSVSIFICLLAFDIRVQGNYAPQWRKPVCVAGSRGFSKLENYRHNLSKSSNFSHILQLSLLSVQSSR